MKPSTNPGTEPCMNHPIHRASTESRPMDRPRWLGRRIIRQVILILAMLLGLLMITETQRADTLPAPPEDTSTTGTELSQEQIEASSELIHTFELPLRDGKFHVGELLGHTADRLGLDGDAIEEKIDIELDLAGKLANMLLPRIEDVTRGVIRTEPGDDSLVITLDRLRLRREEKQARTRLRDLIEALFPDAAEAAQSRYGIWIYPAPPPEVLDGPLSYTSAESAPIDPTEAKLPSELVVLVHGLDDPGQVWMTLRPALLREGVAVAQFEYPNDQPIEDSTRFMAEELRQLKSLGVERVTLVAHSMGGLVSRHLLTDPRWYARQTRGHDAYPDVRRLIMIGTPQHGSELARLQFVTEIRDQVVRACSGDGLLFGCFFDGTGEAMIDLLPGSEFLTRLNARPHPKNLDMTIIAGRVSPITQTDIEQARIEIKAILEDEQGQVDEHVDGAIDDLCGVLETLVSGVGDGAVSLESSRLEGVDDYRLVEGNHLSMIRNVFQSSKRVPPGVDIIRTILRED